MVYLVSFQLKILDYSGVVFNLKDNQHPLGDLLVKAQVSVTCRQTNVLGERESVFKTSLIFQSRLLILI